MSEFTTILSSVLSADKTTRTEAEAQLEALLATTPVETAINFTTAMTCTDETVSSLAAVLFRRKILDSGFFLKFDTTTKTNLINTLVALVVPGRTTSFLKKVGDILANIASNNDWSNQFFTLCINWGSIPDLKILSLYLMEISVEFPKLLEILEQNVDNVIQLLVGFFNDYNRETVLSAVSTLVSLLSGLQEETKVMKYSSLAPTILQAVSASSAEEKLKSTLTSIADLTEIYPRFWKDHTFEFVKSICSKTLTADPDTRSAAIEVLITIVQRSPGLIKKNKDSITEICQTAMTLTYEIDNKEDLEEWTKDETDMSVTTNDPYSLGKDLLSKSAKFLDPSNVLPFFLQTIPVFLQDADWVKQHTALLTVGLIAEGCHGKFEENLTEILAMVTPFASSPNPRLQWAYATTIGLLCSEFEPKIQTTFHAQVLPTLMNVLTTTGNLKVQVQAVAAMVNFIRGFISDDDVDLAPIVTYAPTVLKVLATLLQNASSFKLMNETLGAISITATAMENQFAPYYAEFIPTLKNLMTMTFATPEQLEVRANTVKCIGHCVESISENPGAYYEDVKTILAGLVTLKSGLDSEDPTTLAINEVISQFADCLKAEFMPYMEVFMPDLLTKASATVDMAFTDADVELPTGMNAVSFDLKGQGTKQIAVNTTVLQHKIKACRIFYDLVSSLKAAFLPYVEPTLNVLIPLFNYTFNNDIRKYSVKTIVAIFVASESIASETLIRTLTPHFVKALSSPTLAPEDCKRLIKGLQACLEHVQNKAVIGLAAATEIAAVTANCVKNVFERKIQRKNEVKTFDDPDMYTEEMEDIKKEDETDDKILSGVMEVVGTLLKGFKKEFQATFLQYFKNLYGEIFFKETATDNEILAAICIFDDYVENTQDLLWNGPNSPILDQMLKYTTHKNASIRQSAVFGLGICAQSLNVETFAPFIGKALEGIRTLLTDPKARTEKYDVATDCAVGALGKIALFHNESLLQDWVNYLPIKAEPEESQSVHNLFLNNFEKVRGLPRAQTVLMELKNLAASETVLDVNGFAMLSQLTQ